MFRVRSLPPVLGGTSLPPFTQRIRTWFWSSSFAPTGRRTDRMTGRLVATGLPKTASPEENSILCFLTLTRRRQGTYSSRAGLCKDLQMYQKSFTSLGFWTRDHSG